MPIKPGRSMMLRTLSVAALCLLAACGGGGGDDDAGASPTPSPTPVPGNGAPAFTSATSASVEENGTAVFYKAAATDPDGDAITFSIAGGADAERFAITPAGELRFANAPDYERPNDADKDRLYRVQIAANDGKVTTTLDLTVTLTNAREGIAVRRVATGFQDPVALAPISDTAMLVAEKAGAIYLLNPQTGAKSQMAQVANVGGAGVVAITPRRDFATSGRFYVLYTQTAGRLVLAQFTRNPAAPTVPDGGSAILSETAPDYAGGGWLGYAPDGALLVAIGDAGGSGDPSDSAQSSGFLGKLLRYSAISEPTSGSQFHIYSQLGRGLHQPIGAGWLGGDLLVADRGETVADEVSVHVTGRRDVNFGWPFKEGTRVVRGTPPADVVDPVIEYPVTAATRATQGIVGGAFAPDTIPALRGRYVIADRSGVIFTVDASALRQGTTLTADALERREADFAPDQGSLDRPVALTTGTGGALFLVDGDGEVFRVDAG